MSQLSYSPFNNPFGALNRLHRELDRVFDDRRTAPQDVRQREAADWTPPVDIIEDEQGFSVHLDLPGVDPKDVDITVDKSVLSITGQRTLAEAEAQAEASTRYKRRERFSGNFVRQFTLPESADGSTIKARAEHGVLHIRIPKGERSRPLNITVEG